MIVQLTQIKRDVRVALDEDRDSATLINADNINALKMDDIIESKVAEAVDRVHGVAPYWMLEQGHNFNDDTTVGSTDYPYGIHWAEMESGWVLLPDDFLRMVVFEMSDWERPVYAFITPADAEYAKQRSRVKAIRGTAQRPVCALVLRPEGKALEFYSCKSNEATIGKAVYIPCAAVESGGIDISERCYTAVVYTVAGLVVTALGEAERSKVFFEAASTYLNK